jgi:hypothetical protein
MRRVHALPVAILSLNVAWLLNLADKTGRTVALAGTAIALIPVLLPLVSSRARLYLQHLTDDVARIPAAPLVLPFLLPAISFMATPTIAFVSIHGGFWLVMAWLWAGVLLLRTRSTATNQEQYPGVPAATFLLLFWVSVLWLIVVSNVGIGRVTLEMDRTVPQACRSDTLTTVFSIWEANAAREHILLAWRSSEDFERRSPYANHGHPYLLAMYAWTRTVRAFMGVPPYVATNTVPFLYLAVILAAFTTLVARAGLLSGRPGLTRVVILFVTYGWIVTGWRFWNDLYRFNSDNLYPLLAGLLVFVYAFLVPPLRPTLAAVSAVVVVAISPIHAPMLVLASLTLFGQGASTLRDFVDRNRSVLRISFWALAVGVITYLLPRMLIAWKGYIPQESSYMLRAGLDGDTRYFSNVVQAVVAPCPVGCCFPRTADQLIWPAFVPLLLTAVVALRRGFPRTLSIGHLLLFLTTPYWISAILFPQSVSIHTYLYDHLLLAPVIVVGAATVLVPRIETRLRGGRLLLFLLISAGLLMANLISIAQAAAAMAR